MTERMTIGWDELRDVDLDPDNPRHESGMRRREIIAQLVRSENVLPLARDIAKNGLNPLERFGAVRDAQGDLVIVEGNRRLCALMLLHDPSLAPTAKDRSTFERLAAKIDTEVEEIELEIFETREEADVWLERKHMGENAGLGPRRWNAVQQARHFGSKTNNALALALITYAEEKGFLPKNHSNILTTVTRFVSNPYVRRHGLGIDTGVSVAEYNITGTRSLFDKRLRALMNDIEAGTNGATSRTNAKQRESYAKTFLASLHDDEPTQDPGDGTDSDGDDTDTSSGGAGGSESEGDDDQEKKPGAKPSDPSSRRKLLHDEFRPSLRADRLQRVLHELQAVDRRTPLLAAVAVRIFIEVITIAYIENRLDRQVETREKLHMQVQEVLKDVSARAKTEEVTLTKDERFALTLLSKRVEDTGWVYSAGYLGMVAHGTAFPEWPTLTATWDEIAPVVELLAGLCEKPLPAT